MADHGAAQVSAFTLFCLFVSTTVKVDAVVTAGCHWVDHQECNDLCLVDSFWYGTCTFWDGVQLSCRCYPYRSPLNGSICSQPWHKRCKKECVANGRRTGYCYPQVATESSIEPNCACLE